MGAVSLASKLPWSTNYELHSSRRVGAMDVMHATGAPVFESMFNEGQGGEAPATGPVSPSGVPASRVAAAPPPGGATNGVVPNGGGGGGGRRMEGAGGALGASWGENSSGPETSVANPMVGAGNGNGRGRKTAAVGGEVEAEAEVPAPEVEIAEVMGQEDEGAGVFGAILHEPGVCVCMCVWVCVCAYFRPCCVLYCIVYVTLLR